MLKTIKLLSLISAFLLNSTLQATGIKLSQIESYLNDLYTLQANFEQWDQNGAYTTGKIYLQKPGKIRLNYNAPSKLVILGDGRTLFFIDRGTGDLSHTPIANSPASFLLSKTTNLQSDFNITHFTYDTERVELTLTRKNNPDLGSLTLVFRRAPTLELAQWIVTDPQEKKIMVKLNTLKKNTQKKHKKNRAPDKTLDPALFDSSILLG